MKITLIGALTILSAAGTFFARPALAQATCKPGFVWREAFSGDTVCVTPQRREQVRGENAAAPSNRSPTGGTYGPNTCLTGFVWRQASPSDLVCVSPPSRDLAAQENANAAGNVAGTAPSSSVPAYQLSDWSSWTRIDGAEYHYRFGWNPRAANFPANIDAIFEVRNRLTTIWPGAVRAVDCHSNVLGIGSRDFTLRPGETQTFKFSTPNCGTGAQPFFKPSVVRSNTL